MTAGELFSWFSLATVFRKMRAFRDLKAILGKSTANFKPYTFNGHIDMNATFPVSPLHLLLGKDLWRLISRLVLVGACSLSYIIDAYGNNAFYLYM